MSCPPRYATRRRLERETFGHELAAIAEKLGQPLMPWQRYVADVGCEVDPATGHPAYREVRVTIPRQSGKTTLFLAWQINRCVSRRWAHPQRSAFTAQTGKDARDKWIDELFPLIRNSRLKSLVATKGSRLEINEGMGNEAIRFKTGSLIRLLSTATTSGHSKTLHQAVMDEVWHDVDDRREQGLRPAMITISDAQLLVCSTAGTDASVVLNRKVETGRAAVEADVGVGVAYFEWSAPDGWDPEDEASYFTFMPALCPDPPCRCAPPGEGWRHTITLEALRAEREAMETPEFKRAYGNIKASHADEKWRVVTEDQWTTAQDPHSAPVDPLVFGIAVFRHEGRVASCIGLAGSRGDGDIHIEVPQLDHRPGTGWVVERAKELHERWRPAAWVVDPGSPAGSLIPDLEAAGLEVEKLSSRNVAQAFGLVYDGLTRKPGELVTLEDGTQRPVRRIWHRDDPRLATATAAASTRRVGNDGSTWDCRETDLTPLLACGNAVWGLLTLPEPEELQPWVMYA